MTLAHEIQKFQQEMLGQVPKDILELFNRKTEELLQSGIAQKALHSGDYIPHFILPNVFGNNVDAGKLLDSFPLVINFYRGSW